MRRRDFLISLGGAAATTCPLMARAQQQAMPVVGFLSGRSQEEASGDTISFNQGLNEMGYVDGRNVGLEYRWAEGRTTWSGGRSQCSPPSEAITRPAAGGAGTWLAAACHRSQQYERSRCSNCRGEAATRECHLDRLRSIPSQPPQANCRARCSSCDPDDESWPRVGRSRWTGQLCKQYPGCVSACRSAHWSPTERCQTD